MISAHKKVKINNIKRAISKNILGQPTIQRKTDTSTKIKRPYTLLQNLSDSAAIQMHTEYKRRKMHNKAVKENEHRRRNVTSQRLLRNKYATDRNHQVSQYKEDGTTTLDTHSD
jgi:hypothetical protein